MRTIKPKANLRQPARPRPKLLPISEEMRRWSALLESELLSWPGVITKRMFGFRALYRGKRIFAALPHSRGFGPDASVLLKFDPMPPALLQQAERDNRLHSNTPGKGWFSFTLSSDTDLHDALAWLNHAYESAKGGHSR
jgi:luciferase-like monooxygenase